MRMTVTLALTAMLAGCAIAPNDTAQMPRTAGGGQVMNQNEAIALAGYALKDPANTRGNPALAARAIAAEDWLAGQSWLTPDFGNYEPVNEVFWGDLRRQVRASIGVAPGTPSQVVVDRLIAASDALKSNQPGAAEAQLQPPAFTLGPQRTLEALNALPPYPAWASAFYDLDRNENKSTPSCMMGSC